MTSPLISSKLELHGAAATSSPHSLIYLPSPDESIVYASNCIVNIAKPVKDDEEGDDNSHSKNDDDVIYNVYTTVRTSTLPREKGCMIRAITSMTLLKPMVKVEDELESSITNIIACAYSDGTLTILTQRRNNENSSDNDSWEEDIVVGITGDEGDNKQDECCDSITDIDGVYRTSPSNGDGTSTIDTIIVTSSSNGVQCYKHTIVRNSICALGQQTQQQPQQTQIASYPTSSIKITKTLNNQLILGVGTAMPRHNRIHVYSLSIVNDVMNEDWKHQGSLLGHLGWVTCLDWLHVGEHIMLASGSHDTRIRLWKFHCPVVCDDDSIIIEEQDVSKEMIDDDGDDDGDDEMEEGEARMYIRYMDKDGILKQSAVTLEALLIGHEEQVTALSWRPMSTSPCLISSSMDRSILIWMEENDCTYNETIAIEGVGNVWAPVTRVGTAGGILGGSVGSSLLGFVNVMWNGDGSQIIGHGYGGAVYFWSRRSNNNSDSEIERWRADPCITGHFRGCSDISWEVSEGLYLLSTSLDQTCRLWTYLPSSLRLKSRIWREVGRPQVHGYDLNAVACIGNGNGEMKHRFVSGADEKEARSFDAPVATLKLLSKLHGEKLKDEEARDRVDRAFIPSLGLSNRETAADAMEEDSYGNTGKDMFASNNLNTNSEVATSNSLATMIGFLPHERDLGVTSLWPEVRKLYGHQTELVCLASNAGKCDGLNQQILLASSCKARDAENAAIRIWDVERNMCVDVLKDGHKATVTSMSFSSDGRFLASSGKDRRLCLWKRDDKTEGTKFHLALMVEAAHKRIVWSLDFCPSNPSLLCTGSRDGYLKIWCIIDSGEENCQLSIEEIHRWEPSGKKLKKAEPITAVSFAPIPLQSSAVLAVGLENGLVELWMIPLNQSNIKVSCSILHSIRVQDCHIGPVKKLAWKPTTRGEQLDVKQWDCTLASCSTDCGVRIFRIKQGH